MTARAAWDRAVRLREAGDLAGARRWLERAHRLLPEDSLVQLTLGAILLQLGEPGAAVPLLERVARYHDAHVAWLTLASCHLALDDEAACLAALAQASRSSVPTPGVTALVAQVTARWGHPIALETPAIRITGLVAENAEGLGGWAWYPADPDRDPRLTVTGPRGVYTVTATALAEGVDGLQPLARPRRFAIPAREVERIGTPVHVTDAAGHVLLGSPLGDVAMLPPQRGPARSDLRARMVDVVIPVYGAAVATLACLASVLASVPASTLVHVVDDASPDPELVAALERLRADGRILLHRHAENRGFPAAANTGMRAAASRDVVLLNSDALVPPGWLDRLRAAAYAAADIGSATPFSNEATIMSYADGSVAELDRIAQAANAGRVADIPVGVGFCLLLRRDCLDQVGLFREDAFAQGYGEESDLCLRATQAGWRHVAALDVFVGHAGGRSFGTARARLQRRNAAVLNRLHPGYDALIARHIAADPLFAARRRMDELRFASARREGAVLLVTHGGGGGVAELVDARAASVRVSGRRAIVLLPASGGCMIEGFPDLRYAVPAELPALAGLLRPDRPSHMEVHHLLGHRHEVLALAGLLDVPIDSWVHDWAHFCPRINLIGGGGRYCGEPAIEACEACVATFGSHLREEIGVAALVARSAAEFADSRRVVVATADGVQRLRRHFPGVRPEIEAWEQDRVAQPPDRREGNCRIVVVGAIAPEKGYDVLLDCADDAQRRALPLDFVVCGFTQDDERLMARGNVFVTGRYAPAEAVSLIRAQAADLAFLPSIWPETWCFALSRAWQAGLHAVAFDLGAQAARIRASGRGTLLPLALPVPAINDALLRLARQQRPRQSPAPCPTPRPNLGDRCQS